jgi:hypothetical protein
MRSSRAALAVLVAAAAVGAVAVHVYAQSPAATARGTVAGRSIEIRYAAPSVRARQIFGPGGLVSNDPTYPVWRAGANSATTMVTSGDLEVGGLHVPAGTYTLYALVKDPNAWELIVNRQTGQWGLSYDQSRDLGRVKMAMSKPVAPVETLKYTIADRGNGKGELRLEWEQRVATVAIEVK